MFGSTRLHTSCDVNLQQERKKTRRSHPTDKARNGEEEFRPLTEELKLSNDLFQIYFI